MAVKISELFIKDKKPQHGLLAVEWVIMGYMVFTLLMMAFLWTDLVNPEAMLGAPALCRRNTCRMGSLLGMALPPDIACPYRSTNVFLGLVVSRHLRDEPPVAEP